MHDLWSAVILGVVEGLTEFLPVSSTGHLILTNSLLGLKGEKIAAFNVVIQLGAILAVVLLYRDRFLGLLKTDPERSFSGFNGLLLLFLTTLPALLIGPFADDYIESQLFHPTPVAIALAVGAVAILLIERGGAGSGKSGVDSITRGVAFGVGVFQCIAMWPGFSRSAATIMGGMLLGLDRKTAAEYSFLAAVPVMVAASGYKLLTTWKLYEAGDFMFLAVGFVVSFISAWAAVKAFIALLTRVTLKPFAWYRLALAPLVLLFWPD